MPKIPFWVFIVLALLHLSAGYISPMDVDASQYAEMSREMANSHNWLFLFDRGMNYLDKPPFLFWVSAFSIRLFGVSSFAYKLPSVLFGLWALYATYRLARLLYGGQVGRMAALVLGTCQGMFLMTNDVRTDTILMSCVITAIWMIKEAEARRKWYWVLGGTLSIACGMMTKGPIALMVPLFCFGTNWVLKRQWKKLFSPWHLLDLALIALFLLPMSIGLNQQYDLHPEKIVNGHTGVSGLRFFYWTQSFGRITGENEWNNGAGIEFLMLNMLWSFLPWIFLFLPALFLNIKQLVQQKLKLQPGQEWITAGGFLLAYLALGLSHYQLPHYIFVVFPLAAIITAKLAADMLQGSYPALKKVMTPAMHIITFLLFIGVLLILLFTFPAGIPGVLVWTVAVGVWVYFGLLKAKEKLFWSPAIGIMLINIFLTHHFYRKLLHYQAGTVAGTYIYEHLQDKTVKVYDMEDPLNALHFYAQKVIPGMNKDDLDIQPGDHILIQPGRLEDIKQKGYSFDIVKQGTFFKVSELTPDFLNSKTREKAVKQYCLIRIH